jgi:hypothetical protein
MKIKASGRYHFIPTKSLLKKDNKCWRGYGEDMGHLYIAGVNVEWYSTLENSLAVS